MSRGCDREHLILNLSVVGTLLSHWFYVIFEAYRNSIHDKTDGISSGVTQLSYQSELPV